jgi:acetyl-CoA carboxylase carboxyltransferase component
MRDVPLYVWNDGAGANVRQGMVALNRAAEGFMMNALTAEGVDYVRFLATVRSVGDPVLGQLFRELDETFDLSLPANRARAARNFVSVAIGVGSATGLDVYGSSQACIQIMLDSEQSYRVLTGSNVIRAVTGESLTNYEIGGARVMAHWTGTVDLVARDRMELLRHVRRVHMLFTARRHHPLIARSQKDAAEPEDGFADTVLNERRITFNVDHGSFVAFKSEYVEAGGLVGGFARLGGKHVLVMGPRTDAGVRSYASLVRTRDLLRIADKTRSPKILVVGKRWYRAVGGEDESALRAQIDLARQLGRPGTPRIHIVTRPEGLMLAALNCQADATIYVRRRQDTEKDRRVALKTATFQVGSLAEAFDLANRILGFFDQENGSCAFDPPRKAPSIPLEPSQPFDMVVDVIEAIFDEGSFLEFHRDPEDRPGSSLVTGLATLGGAVVGVIADQPLGGAAPDAPGTEKFRMFVEFLEWHRFPLVMLSNAPGFVPGTKQERLRIQQIGGESLDVNVLSSIPVVSVVLNQNFGGRQIHAFSRFLRPGIAYVALSRATLAVMGASAAFDLFHGARSRELAAAGDQAEADRIRNEFIDGFNRKARADEDATTTGVLDWTIRDTAGLRAEILRAMEVARARADEVKLASGLANV